MKLEDIKDIDVLQNMVAALWSLLDNIDTIEDIVKSNDKGFREGARKQHLKRHEILTSDGYELFLPEGE